MKTTILIPLTLCLLLVPLLQAEDVSKSKDIELLRQETRKQELVLQALNEKLQRIDMNEDDFYEISIHETGFQFNGNPVSQEELETALKVLPNDTKIMIRAESAVKHKKVASVMELCAKADLTDIVFATTGQRR